MGLGKKQKIKLLKFWKENPVRFLTDCLDVDPKHVWDKMEEICNSVRDHQFTCVKAGNSLSKSYTVGRLALWFLYTHKPSTVFTTAPSNIQVEDILWREIRDAWYNAKQPLGGQEPLKTSLTPDPKRKWFATGFATKADSGSDQATRVLGFHNEDMLIILDEAPGVDPSIWNAIKRLMTNERVKLLVIGNPVFSSGNFVDCFKDPKFNKITVSAFDTPNYKEGREVIPGLAGRKFVEDVRNEFGEGSSQWKSMITGEIPSVDSDSLIPFGAIENALKRKRVLPTKSDKFKFTVWDVADGGSDLNTIKHYEDMKIVASLDLYNKTIEEAYPLVIKFNKENEGNAIIYDADGRGRVAGGYLEMVSDREVAIIAFEGSSRDVQETDSFYNIKDEAHWNLRDYIVNDKIAIGLVDKEEGDKILEELCSAKEDCSPTNGPKAKFIRIEDKKKEHKRLRRSPDHRDNLMMACYADAYFDLEPVEIGRSRYKIELNKTNYPFNPNTV